jgi:hydroxymethylglutaryl-CoA reductase (NADPH)
LWLRLYGYDVRLVPYQEWLARLDAETRNGSGRAHPLRPLRPFFLRRVRSDRGRTLPELLTGSDRDFGVSETIGPPLDAALLQRYCDAFVACGDLPPGRPRTAGGDDQPLDVAFFSRVLERPISRVEPLGRLSEHGIISELTAWQSGRSAGLFRFRLHDDSAVLDVVVKVKPRDRDVLQVGQALSHLCDGHLGAAYDRWSERLGILNAGRRELAIYRQQDPRFLDHTPALYGGIEDRASGTTTLVLESLSGSLLCDSADRPHLWQPAHVDCAIRGLARLHAIWFNREAELLRQPWIGYVANPSRVAEMTEFWKAMAAHARPAFVRWTDRRMADIHDRLIDRVGGWWPALDEGPRTLIHNDFNPRNVCLRPGSAGPRLAAYDWELAAIGAPQRDLVEFLCFVLPERPTRHEVESWLERHRTLLEDETGTVLNRRAWQEGFRSALYDLMLNRLPMYCLIDRVRRQSFLPRVVRTWRALYAQFPL